MKQRTKILGSLILIGFLLFSGKAIYAASASVAFSANSGTYTVGDTFVVTLTAESSEGISGFQTYVAYDPGVLELVDTGKHVMGSDGLVQIQDLEGEKQIRQYRMKFRALNVGDTEVYISDTVYMYAPNSNEQMSVSQNTLPLTIEERETATTTEVKGLASLTVNPGTLTPAFDPSVTTYQVQVPNETTTLYIDAKTKLKAETVTVTGNDQLKEGMNTATITVNGKNGNQKQYVIQINRMTSGEEQLQKEEVQVEATTTPDTKSVEGGSASQVYESQGTLHLRTQMDLEIVPIPDSSVIPKGYVQLTADIHGKQIIAYAKEGQSNYLLLYGKMGDETSGFYVYDKTGDCLQRYDEALFASLQDEKAYEQKTNTKTQGWYWIVIAILGVMVILLLVLLGKKNAYEHEDFDHYEED